ncbi:MAG: D-2-hydroxyacid dehydrogenase [Victivallaceae bacterium]
MDKIVILDGYAANPGDLSWNEFAKLGKLEIYDRTPPELTVARSQGAMAVITNKTLLDGTVLAKLCALRYIGVTATGYNMVDLNAAREHGIIVTNVPAYSTESVAQTVFAHILNLTQHVAEHAESVRVGEWCSARDFCYWKMPLFELCGRTLGIYGFGAIGQAVARTGTAFGMKIIVASRTQQKISAAGYEAVTPEELFRRSDILSLHCPLTADNHGMVNAQHLALMKSTAFLINTARGGLIDEKALAEALNCGGIAGAGLDVLSSEPPQPDNPLLSAKNCYITPHLAWATKEARMRLLHIAAENMRAFINGAPVNVVS